MICKQTDQLLDDYVDGLLDEAARTRLDDHIAACDDCRAAVEHATSLQSILKDYGESSMPTPDAAYFDQALARAARTGFESYL